MSLDERDYMKNRRNDPTYNPKEFRGSKANFESNTPPPTENDLGGALFGLIILILMLFGIYYHHQNRIKANSPDMVNTTASTNNYTPSPIPFPATKIESYGGVGKTIVPLHVKGTQDGRSCYLQIGGLINNSQDMHVAYIWVRSGEVAMTNIPAASYTIDLTCGTQWYGDDEYFRNDPLVVTLKNPLDFTQIGSPISKGAIIDLEQGSIEPLPTNQVTPTLPFQENR